MSPTLEDQERHLLVKVIDRILYKLDDLVRPYVHKVSFVLYYHISVGVERKFVKTKASFFYLNIL